MSSDGKDSVASIYSQILSRVVRSDEFSQIIARAVNKNESAQIRLSVYKESLKSYLGEFRTEVIKDFKFNREHDRKIKRALVRILFAFSILLFLILIFTVLAFVFGWGIAGRLSAVFQLSFFTVLLAGIISLITIIFKYIFNKTDDVFYHYSVDLYKHIVEERSIPTDDSDK